MVRDATIKLAFLSIVLTGFAFTAHAQDDGLLDIEGDMADFDVAQLINLTVTSPGKKEQAIRKVASAISVLTNDQIRRSGATSIPEALRLVPGLHVARINADQWAISARGVNGRFTDDLLVLIDGRTVYNSIFSGVFWDDQDVMLEDVDRIEVIRGPGATLWGSNAVNGVINIITKESGETSGGLLNLGGGSEDQGFGGLRYGGTVGEDTDYRVYAKGRVYDDTELVTGGDTPDGWESVRGGFRVDHDLADDQEVTVQGDVQYSDLDGSVTIPTLTPPFSSGLDIDDRESVTANVLGRWSQDLDTDSDVQVQVYYDLIDRDEGVLDISQNTFDIDFQHRFPLGESNDVIWGGGYRYIESDLEGTVPGFLWFDPERKGQTIVTGFIQDQITIIEDVLDLIIGTKLEFNDFSNSDLEVQPSVRTVYTPNDTVSVWAAVSRAVRTPGRTDRHLSLSQATIPPNPMTFGLPAFPVLTGNSSQESEDTLAYEVGARAQVTDEVAFDVAFFYNDVNDVLSISTGMPFVTMSPMPTHVEIPLNFGNDAERYVYGVETTVDINPVDWLNVLAAYTFLDVNVEPALASGDEGRATSDENSDPEHQVLVRAQVDLPNDVELDLIYRAIDELSDFGIGSYSELDARLGWRATEDIEIAVVGENLIDDSHREYDSTFILQGSSEIERAVKGEITVTF